MDGWMKRRRNGEENGPMIGFIRDWKTVILMAEWMDKRTDG
jgi:hypothetical protein